MAGPNPFLQSPFQSIIDGPVKPLPGAQQVKEVDTPDLSDDDAPAAAPAPAPAAQPAPARDPASLLPPESMRPLFEATAAHFKVPVNVLMAIAQQESTYNPDAVNKASGAAGIGGYMDATAKSLGINAHDPNEAVPAIAQQLRERLDKGYSMADAVKEHFAGPDRKLWGDKTAAYGQEVLDKAGQIGQQLYGDSTDTALAATAPSFTPGAEQNQFDPNRMARADYEKEFRALNPKASDAAVQNAMAQYDQQAAAKTEAAGNRIQNKFATLQSPEAMFDQRLNAKLQAGNQGVAQALPERQQPAAFPETGTPDQAPDASTLDTIGGNLAGGAIGTLVGAIAASAKLVGADDVAKEYSEGLDQIHARQKELGGDTMTGKVAGLVGGIVPALAGAPEYKVLEFAKNAGLFGIPAFQETYQAKLAEGQSNKLALVHAFESFGMNTLAPMVMQHGVGAVIGKLGAEGAAGLKGAALGMGQAAGEGVAFSAANSVMDKGTDALAGQQNDRSWLDPEDMAVQAAGFGALRAGHMVGHAVGSMVEPQRAPAGPLSAALDAAAGVHTSRIEPTLTDPAMQQETADAVARADQARAGGASVVDQLRAIRNPDQPLFGDAPGPLTAAVERAADLHAVDPAPAPPAPEPEPPALDTLPMEDLRAKLRDVAQQVKAATDPAQRKVLMGQRGEIEKAIATVGKQATADSKPAVEPLSAGPFDDMKAANRMMQRYAEETGQPHEVVGSDGKFKVQPIEGARDGIDTAGTGTGPDGRGRSGGPADEVGSDISAGRAGTGTGIVEGERAGIDRTSAQRGADAGDHRTGSNGAADAKPALTEHPQSDDALYAQARDIVTKNGNPSVSLVQRHLRVGYNRAMRMMERMEADGIVSPMKPDGSRTILTKEAKADVPERPQVPEEAPVARGKKGAKKPEASTAPAVVDRNGALLKELEQIGSTRAQVLEFRRDRAREKLANLEAHPHINKHDQAEEVAKLTNEIADLDAVEQRARDLDAKDARDDTTRAMLKGAKQELDAAVRSGTMTEQEADAATERARATGNAVDASDAIYSTVDRAVPRLGAAGTGAAPAAEGRLAARRALNDRQDAVVKAAIEKLAARKAANAEPAAEAAQAPEPAREVPKSFMKKVKVDHEVYIRDERRWETVKVPADKALASVREDISNLEALLNCMKG